MQQIRILGRSRVWRKNKKFNFKRDSILKLRTKEPIIAKRKFALFNTPRLLGMTPQNKNLPIQSRRITSSTRHFVRSESEWLFGNFFVIDSLKIFN